MGEYYQRREAVNLFGTATTVTFTVPIIAGCQPTNWVVTLKNTHATNAWTGVTVQTAAIANVDSAEIDWSTNTAAGTAIGTPAAQAVVGIAFTGEAWAAIRFTITATVTSSYRISIRGLP